MIITEIELRANWHKNKESVITLPQGSVITPAARDFIRSKGIRIEIEGEGIRDKFGARDDCVRYDCVRWTQSPKPKLSENNYPAEDSQSPKPKLSKNDYPAETNVSGDNSVQRTLLPNRKLSNEHFCSEDDIRPRRHFKDSLPPMVSRHEARVDEHLSGQDWPREKSPFSNDVAKAVGRVDLKHGGGPDQPVKPEHMTHLHNSELVLKTHPIIALRGQLDLFQSELTDVQVFFQQEGEETLIRQLEEIAAFARQLMVCEVKQEPFTFTALIGLNADELRERSHHPGKYFGVEHTPLSYTHGKVVAKLHLLRAKAREVEQYANRAFIDEAGNCTRTDLVQALNRLSSALYIMACEVRSRVILEKKIPIGISNRHVHLSRADLGALFGENYALTVESELSQPGEFAAQETVTLVGPKGFIENVRVLGPARKKTQVEVSVTDCFRLGIKPVVRDSGQHEGTPGLMLVGTVGTVDLEKGVIVAGRHIHLHTEEAKAWLLKNGDRVRVQIPGKRPVLFDDVLVRVSESYRMEMHLDTDEANAALIGTQSHGLILGVKHDE